jgi:hypothetical protein
VNKDLEVNKDLNVKGKVIIGDKEALGSKKASDLTDQTGNPDLARLVEALSEMGILS